MADVISVTERSVFGIGRTSGGLDAWENKDFAYDWAIAGQPFLSAASDKYPAARGLVQVQKQQIDTSGDAGEQTLSTWWTRSQRDWSGGAGQDYLEPPDDDLVMRRYYDSFNVDVWDQGHIKLLHGTESVYTGDAPLSVVNLSDLNDEDAYVLFTDGSNVGLISRDGQVTMQADALVARTLCSQGHTAFGISDSGDLVKYSISEGLLDDTVIHSGLVGGRVGYAKERLIVAIGPKLYQLSPNGDGSAVDLDSQIYEHTDPNWEWVSTAETPASIIVSGKAGQKGVIYQFTVADEQDAQTLDQGKVIAELPNGEYPTSMQTYIGTYLLIGTNLGARVGVISEQDTISYGPLSYDRGPVYDIELQGKFAYLGVTADIDDRGGVPKTGMVRLDLSEPSDLNFYAFSNDQTTSSTEMLTQTCQLGESGGFAIATTSEIFITTPALAPFGYLRTSRIRYSTLENKTFQLFKLVHGQESAGRVTVTPLDENDEEAKVNIYDSSTQLSVDVGIQPSSPQQYMSFVITLNRDTETTGPVIDGYTVKAIPLIERKQIVRVPLLCFDVERDRFGVTSGVLGSALTRFRNLRDACSTGEPVLLQDLVGKETLIGVVEDLEFNQTSPPAQASGFGGIVYVTMREL
jgi:hypothetical protein